MKSMLVAAALATAVIAAPASAATYIYNVTGATSNSGLNGTAGGLGNTVASIFLGAGAHITGSAYNVTIQAFDPSYLSEARLAYTNSAVTVGVQTTPGVGVGASGTQSFTGSADLTALGLDFFLGADGILRLEFNESFADASVNPDAIWRSGTFSFTYDVAGGGGAVPEPSVWAMMLVGFAFAGSAMRYRRRKTTVSFA